MARRSYGNIAATSGNVYEIVVENIMDNGIYPIYLVPRVGEPCMIGGHNSLERTDIISFSRDHIEGLDLERSN